MLRTQTWSDNDFKVLTFVTGRSSQVEPKDVEDATDDSELFLVANSCGKGGLSDAGMFPRDAKLCMLLPI